MKHFTVRQFKDACHARYFGPEEALDQELSGVETDSRGVTKGTLFVAIPGERVDGHKFIPDVYAKGAACALSQQELTDPAGPYLLVEDTQQALKEAAESYRQTLGHSGHRYYRKCRKDQHQGDGSFHFEPEI